ncbi:MAG: hypothetical protein K5907_04605 [Treponema sp.]|nr:hypothetical protein [Treponema sp.]
MAKQAIIHVENTEGVIEFAQFLSDAGWTILSANRTEEILKKAKIPVEREPALVENNLYLNDTSSLIKRVISTSFYSEQEGPGVQDPGIGILCVNVQPAIHVITSEKKFKSITKPFNFFVSTLLRNAFLNYENILILSDPNDYKEAMIQLRTDSISQDFRIKLAAKALNLVSAFDGGIASSILMTSKDENDFMKYLTYPFEKQFMLYGGANQHQSSCLYRFPGGGGIVSSIQKQKGKELSYNSVSDISFAWEQISMLATNLKNQFSVKSVNCDGYKFETQFTPLTGTVFTLAVYNKSILGASLSTNVLDSFKKTYTYDKENIRRVTFASSVVIDESVAEEIVKCHFTSVVSPGFTAGAKEILSKDKSVNLVQTAKINTADYEMELINGGLLFQTKDKVLFDIWNVKTKNRPGQVFADQMAFGTILTMGSHSYSAVLLKDNSVVGISQAAKSPQRSIDRAIEEAMLHKSQNPDSDEILADVLVCDAPVYLNDSIRKLAEHGLKAILQPGGTDRDEELIQFCNEQLISMIFTGMTHISH